MRRPRITVAVTVALLLLVGCTDADDGAEAPEPEATEGGDVEGKPVVEIAEDAAPPGSLVVEDLEEGDGDEVADGALVTVHVVGVRWSDGGEIVSTWDRGQPISYEHGEGRWIPGWEEGVEGMRAGGRRRIVVPPELGYADRGAPGIPADETLVFVVDLLDVG